MLNPHTIKQDFPIFQQRIHGKPLVFLDNASTTQKPQSVIDALVRYYSESHANVHRGVYQLSEQASRLYDLARETIQHFLHAKHSHEIVFVKGTTEAINLVAESYGRTHLKPGDNIIISLMEHHANWVPWQSICQQMGAELRIIPVDESGALDMAMYEALLSSRTRLVALSHASNVLGTINPIQTLVKMAHAYGAPVLVDGAQAAAHLPIDVQTLDCDFYVFSGHKLYAPTGIGVLYGKTALLEAMPPYQTGGGMIEQVSYEKTTYAGLPTKFEAGTPHIAGAVGLMAAVRYLQRLELDEVEALDQALLVKATQALSGVAGLRIVGTAEKKLAVISFTLDASHPHDVATILDSEGIAVRAGHHCAMPLLQHFHLPAVIRASFGVYNTFEDIDFLVKSLEKAQTILT